MSSKDDAVVERALERYKKDQSHWHDIFERAKEDLHFLSDERNAQWESRDVLDRESTGRPVLTIDQLSQFVHQVSNDIRQNTPSVNVIPEGNGADQETAEVFKGIISGIQYESSADDVRDYAVTHAIKCGYSCYRIDNDYESEEDGFDTKLVIKRIINPFNVYIDSESIEPDGRDMQHANIIDRISVKTFEKRYPKFAPISFGEEKQREYKEDDMVNVSEYFEIDEAQGLMAIDGNGNRIEQYEEGMPAYKVRKVKRRVVMRYLLSGQDVLEKTVFPGKYIPLVMVYGEEAWKDGKRNLFSLIRKGKQAQRMYNYWKSLETELLLKQPNAPVMVAVGQIEDFASDWKDPAKSMALRYKQKDAEGNPAPPPQRLEPPVIPVGVVNAARESVDDIKASLGMYNASIGQRSNETSGKAIMARQREGDVATYHFSDNLSKSVTQEGRILVCAIPEVYDTQRIMRVIGAEDEIKMVGINGAMAEDQERPFDLKKGKYSVRVTTSASYTTLRQEAAETYAQIITQQPQLMTVAGDLLFKNMDFPGAQQLAARMKKLIDPKLLEESEREDVQAVDPEKVQMAQLIEQGQQVIAQMQQQIAALEQQLQSKQIENAAKIKESEMKLQSDAMKAQLDREKMALDAQKLQLEEQKLQLEAKKLELDAIKAVYGEQNGEKSGSESQETENEQENPEIIPEEKAVEQAGVVIRAQQANATLEALNSLAMQLNVLTEKVAQPKQVVRDPNTGFIMGVQ